MKIYKFENAAKTWWAVYRTDGMSATSTEKITSIKSMSVGGALNPGLDSAMINMTLPSKLGEEVTEAGLTAKAVLFNLSLTKNYESVAMVTKATPLSVAAAPTNVVLAGGSGQPVGSVVNVAIPADGEVDYTGQVIDYVVTTADKIKITITPAASTTCAMTMNGTVVASGANYAIPAGMDTVTVVITTTRTSYFKSVRTFIISVTKLA